MSDEFASNRQQWVPVFAFSCLLAAILFAYFVWTSRYVYVNLEKSAAVARIDRVTGEAYELHGKAWTYCGKPSQSIEDAKNNQYGGNDPTESVVQEAIRKARESKNTTEKGDMREPDPL